MKKIELLAPAGDLDRLKIAILYGADAVYIGGKEFSLRARASNFDLEDIAAGVEFAKMYGKKVYVTMNIIPHNEDLQGLSEYIIALESLGVDAIIVASLHIGTLAKKIAPNLEVHLSTQMSVSNSDAVNYIYSLGFERIVLAREVSLDQIKKITENTEAELEVFIHGGMCSSYSGRCLLSNYMTNRDANRGGCAHSCRWNYSLYDEDKKLNEDDKYFNFGSKDLQAISMIPDFIDIGVASLKIEGRMKSQYYIATVIRTYRKLIDDYLAFEGNKEDFNLDYYYEEITKAQNRLTSIGFLKGSITSNEQLYNMRSEIPTKEFVGYVLDYDEKSQMATIEQRNFFLPNERLEFFGPGLENTIYEIDKIYDLEGNVLDAARHPQQILKIFIPFKLSTHDMIRRIK